MVDFWDDDSGAGPWAWFNDKEITIKSDTVDSELLTMLTGTDSTPSPERQVKISTTTDDGKKIDFILYKVQFEPIKFNYWNNWHKRLVKKLFGVRFAYWLYYRNALKIKYTGKALISDNPNEVSRTVGRPRSVIGRMVSRSKSPES